MIAFNFLKREQPAAIRDVLSKRFPKALRTPVLVMAAAVTVVCGAYVIEAERLQSAVALQRTYEARYKQSEALVAQRKIRFMQLQRMVRLDERIHEMEFSGYEDARRLAEIGNRLPARSWLTSIARDSDGITLEGNAETLTALSRTLHALASAKHVANPALLSVALATSDGSRTQSLKYALHVDRAQ